MDKQPIPLNRGERQVDFKIFTRGMEIIKAADPGDTRKRIRCIASSSIEDRHGDTITDACIGGMRKQAVGLTIFRNHRYEVPTDVFGFVEKAAVKHLTVAEAKDKGLVPDHISSTAGDKVALLQLDIVVDESNPLSTQTLASLENGVTLGVSIGAMILDYDEKEGHEDSWWPPLIINEVELLEASVVGIPANPLSWVEGAAKAIAINKGLLGERASRDDLNKLLASKDKPSGAKDDDKAETVPPTNVPDGEDMPDAEEEGADEVGEDTPAAADKDVELPGPNGKKSAADIVETYRASQHPAEDEGVEPLSIKELRILVQDELHDVNGIKPSDEEVQKLLDAIAADQPLEADTTPDSTEEPDPEDTDAQEATEEGSDPETAEGTAAEAEKQAQAEVQQLIEGGILKSMQDAASLIETTLTQLIQEQSRAATLAAENESLKQQLEIANVNVEAAITFVNKFMDLPMVRKSSASSEAKAFSRSLEATYGPEIMNMLNGKGSSE